jgi:Ca2+-binding RTX toxin-like protein
VRSKESIIFVTVITVIGLLLPAGMLRPASATIGGVSQGINKIFSNGGIPGPAAFGGGNIPLPVVSAFYVHSSTGGSIAGQAQNHIIYGIGKSSSTNTNTNNSTSKTVVVKMTSSKSSHSSSTTANTKCISNSPNGAKPQITKHGNVIVGSDCDITIKGDNQGNIIFTGNGNDVVFGGTGNDIIYAGSGTDQIYGGGGKDLLVAGSGIDLLDGGPGDDVLIGGTGNDLLIGGSGNNKLFAGTGTTVMNGGPGANYFDCGTTTTAKAVVMDYNPTHGDIISGNCKLVNNASN